MLWLLIITGCARADVVEILDSSVLKLVAATARLERVTDGQTWTEGPLALADGRLLFADIKTNSIRVVDPRGGVQIVRTPSGYTGQDPYPGPEPGSSAMVRDREGGVVVAGHAGRAIFRYAGVPTPNSARRTLVDHFEGRKLNSPNDLVLARDGSVYFTDPPFGLPTQAFADPLRELSFAGVYRLSDPGGPRQKLKLISKDLRGPNGLAFAPDQRTLYVANTPAKTWVKFTRGDGDHWVGPLPFCAAGGDPRPGEPDGLKVDRTGHVFAAGPGGVWIINPKGRHIGTVRVPGRVTNVAFGGDGRRTLFITAGDSIHKMELKTHD